MSHDSRAVANKILDMADAKGMSLTMMQLIKLVYISHGWWLTYSGGKPLTSDAVQAWQYGPVYPNLYNAFRSNGPNPIRNRAVNPFTGQHFVADIGDKELQLMEQVLESYGRLHAFQLSDMTHQPGTPWSQASARGYYSEIEPTAIREHFDVIRQARAS